MIHWTAFAMLFSKTRFGGATVEMRRQINESLWILLTLYAPPLASLFALVFTTNAFNSVILSSRKR